jgi:hypothetical protein
MGVSIDLKNFVSVGIMAVIAIALVKAVQKRVGFEIV